MISLITSVNLLQVSEEIESESTDLTAAQVDTQTDKAGITFAASDTVSLGLNYLETERKSGGAKDANDEEIIMVSVGYNFGGLGLEMTYAEVENAGNAANIDAEAFQIRTIQKFQLIQNFKIKPAV